MKTLKRPTSISAKERREDKQIALMASLIQSQEQLDLLLADAQPLLRDAMLARILPHLSFVPACPACGMHRGAVITHDCAGAAS